MVDNAQFEKLCSVKINRYQERRPTSLTLLRETNVKLGLLHRHEFFRFSAAELDKLANFRITSKLSK